MTRPDIEGMRQNLGVYSDTKTITTLLDYIQHLEQEAEEVERLKGALLDIRGYCRDDEYPYKRATEALTTGTAERMTRGKPGGKKKDGYWIGKE